MPNPKSMLDKPECDTNLYRDTAHAKESVPTGFVFHWVGPKSAVPHVPWPPAKPLAGAALAALRTSAETNATNEAKAQMNAIAAYPCPSKCKKKTGVSKTLGQASWTGAPRLVNGVQTFDFVVRGVPFVWVLKTQEWVQDAEQDYEVEFTCS